jgi:hypothetical protein
MMEMRGVTDKMGRGHGKRGGTVSDTGTRGHGAADSNENAGENMGTEKDDCMTGDRRVRWGVLLN